MDRPEFYRFHQGDRVLPFDDVTVARECAG